MNELIPVAPAAPVSPLRQRLIDDMNMRHFSRETQRGLHPRCRALRHFPRAPARYRHRRGSAFRYKDYRRSGADRQQVMTLAADEFIRRFLLHVLPRGFHRIRHYGLLAGTTRKDSIALARKLLVVAPPPEDDAVEEPPDTRPPCPCCGGHMIVIEAFARWQQPRAPPSSASPIRELAS